MYVKIRMSWSLSKADRISVKELTISDMFSSVHRDRFDTAALHSGHLPFNRNNDCSIQALHTAPKK